MPYSDLRSYLEVLEKCGKLRRIRKEVDASWEIAAVCRQLFYKFQPKERPAIIFENPKGGYIRHTVNAVYLIELNRKPDVDFEKSGISDFAEVKWLQKIEEDWHPYVKLCLEKAGFE